MNEPHHPSALNYLSLLEGMPSAFCTKCEMELLLSGRKAKLTSPEHNDAEGKWVRLVIECIFCGTKNHFRVIERTPRMWSIQKEWPNST